MSAVRVTVSDIVTGEPGVAAASLVEAINAEWQRQGEPGATLVDAVWQRIAIDRTVACLDTRPGPAPLTVDTVRAFLKMKRGAA